MSQEVIVVFTARSVERLLREGGTSSWRLDRNRARQCSFAVCTRNANADWVEGSEAHHSAFLVGKVREVVPSPEDADRYLILFSEYVLVNIPEVWEGDRNPVRYKTIEDLGIDFSTLNWEPMPTLSEPGSPAREKNTPNGVAPLTIAQAKKGLALTFGVLPEAVEINIRG